MSVPSDRPLQRALEFGCHLRQASVSQLFKQLTVREDTVSQKYLSCGQLCGVDRHSAIFPHTPLVVRSRIGTTIRSTATCR